MSGSTQSKLLLATLQDFGSRIDTVYSLTNKGVHADVAQAEVDTCVMQTYLLAGEILRIFEDSSQGRSRRVGTAASASAGGRSPRIRQVRSGAFPRLISMRAGPGSAPSGCVPGLQDGSHYCRGPSVMLGVRHAR